MKKKHNPTLIFKIIFIFTIVLISLFNLLNIKEQSLSLCYASEKNTISHKDITVLSCNPLIAFPDIAFNSKNKRWKYYDENFLTYIEFENILTSLYLKNYILVKLEDIFSIKENCVYVKDIHLPAGKKPLVLLFENLNYNTNKNNGFVDKIIIDRNNKLASYSTKRSVQFKVDYSNDFIPILEQFVKDNPDFSYNNAKGVLAFSGMEGILGHNTQSNNANSRFEIRRAMELISFLKRLGWDFCATSYSGLDYSNLSNFDIAKDLNKWNMEVSRITNDSLYFSFKEENMDLNKNKETFDFLNTQNKFMFFCENMATISQKNNTCIILKKIKLCGEKLKNNSEDYNSFFDSKDVYDKENRLS